MDVTRMSVQVIRESRPRMTPGVGSCSESDSTVRKV